MLEFDDLVRIKNEVTRVLLNPAVHNYMKIPNEVRWLASNFVGIGVGLKTIRGTTLTRPALTVLVRAKLPEGILGPFHVAKYLNHWKELREEMSGEHWAQLNPEENHWIGAREQNNEPWKLLEKDDIDVIATGTLNSVEGLAGPVNQLTIGADVAMAGRSIHGTVCGFATTDECDGPLLLSCGHVLDSRAGRFRLVTSHGAVVAKIVKQAVLLPGHGCPPFRAQQDAVLGKLIDDVEPNFELPGHQGRLSSGKPYRAYLGMSVIKAGKSVREGCVFCTEADLLVDYPSQISWLLDQIVVKSEMEDGELFAKAGDSGALVMTRIEAVHCGPTDDLDGKNIAHIGAKSQLLPVGMVIAAGDPATLLPEGARLSSQYTVVSPMGAILKELNAELLAR